jgi:hypothetical protein
MEEAKLYLARMIGGAGPRKETRLKGKNTWIYETIVLPNIGDWVQTVLPPGKRTLGVRFANEFYLLDRNEPGFVHGRRACKAGPNFVCVCVGYHIYDMIGHLDQTLVNLPLDERMKRAPTPDGIFSVAQYGPVAPAGDCSAGKRLILIRRASPYTNYKDALSWKPQLGAGLAVLCCRCARACSLIDNTDFLLRDEGAVAGAVKEMASYVCRWNESGRSWKAVREAKRSETLYTSTQCAMSKTGARMPDLPLA